MKKIETYPVMNESIKGILCLSEEPMNLYILARIEELEKQVEDLTPPHNNPLTIEELREMDGEPIHLKSLGERTVDSDGKWRDLDDRYYCSEKEERTT